MNNLKKILSETGKAKTAIGHFNISTLEQLRGIVLAFLSLNLKSSALMIGASEGERKFMGLKQSVYLIKAFREEFGIPVFLNADHSKSVESAKAAFDAGFDSVHIDLSELSYKDNVLGTKEVVDYVKSKSEDVSVEGELGVIKGKSEIQNEIIKIKKEDLTSPEQVLEFCEKTGVDRFAGAFGNSHGISLNEPKLDTERIAKIRKLLPQNIALVLHGGSGIPDIQVREAINAGINNIHVSTEIRVAYVDALKKSLQKNPNEIAPYKVFSPVIEAVKEKTEEKLNLFTKKQPTGLLF